MKLIGGCLRKVKERATQSIGIGIKAFDRAMTAFTGKDIGEV